MDILLAKRLQDSRDLTAALDSLLQKEASNNDNLLPAIVLNYDRKTNLAVVKILIQVVLLNDIMQERKPLARIPVLSMGGGGFHISFPIKNNDIGWLFASDRDLTKFKEELKEGKPNTARMHSFSDGVFIPDVFNKYNINEEDNSSLVIQNVNGNTRISISENEIKITANSKVTINTPQSEFTGNVNIKKDLTIEGNSNISGNLKVDGNTDLTNATAGGIKINGHVHTESEGSTTGGMRN